MTSDLKTLAPPRERAPLISDFLVFVWNARTALKNDLVSTDNPEVQHIRGPIEEHYVDDRGKPSMYQRFESAIYDDAREIVTLWRTFHSYDRDRLSQFHRMLKLELEGLTGDRHPRKVFDRSPFGIAAIVVGTITIWMTILRTYTGEDLSELLESIRFNWIAGTMWVVGLFVVLWYILKTVRNNRQVAVLSSISRALELYLDNRHEIGN
jgi:hypothetical protein